VAEELGAGKLTARATTRENAAIYPLAQCMNQMAERIEGLLGAQRQLVHSVSHELRTPISRIEFGLELLRDEVEGERATARILSMEEDVQELKALVAELLSLSKLDQQQDLRMERLVLEPLLRGCAENVEYALAGKDFLLQLDGELPTVAGDARLLARALNNLLLNATKYAERRIVLSAAGGPGGVKIAVDDDGPGIPLGERERIFEPFYRLDRSRDRATGGFGLGLAIAQRAVRLHGGVIDVMESALGGARFVVRLPLFKGEKKSLPARQEGIL
jgi:two-component system OmpR family sensor kinase